MTQDTQPDTSEQIARMQREHAAMLAFIRKVFDTKPIIPMRDLLDEANTLLQAIDSDSAATPPKEPTPLELFEAKEAFYASLNPLNAENTATEPPVAAGNGARYPISTVTSIHGKTTYVTNGYSFKTEQAAQEYLDTLNAQPASGKPGAAHAETGEA